MGSRWGSKRNGADFGNGNGNGNVRSTASGLRCPKVAPGRSLTSGGYSPEELPTAISQPAGARPSGSWRKGAACPLALGRGGARRGGRRKSRSGARARQRPAEAEPGAAARARKKTRLEGRAESGRAVVRLSRPNGGSPRLGPPTLRPPLARDVSRRGGAERAPSVREGAAAKLHGLWARRRLASGSLAPASDSLLPGWLAALSRVFSRSAPVRFQRNAEPALKFLSGRLPAAL